MVFKLIQRQSTRSQNTITYIMKYTYTHIDTYLAASYKLEIISLATHHLSPSPHTSMTTQAYYFYEITLLNVHMLFVYSSAIHLVLPAEMTTRRQKFNKKDGRKSLNLRVLFLLILKPELGKD